MRRLLVALVLVVAPRAAYADGPRDALAAEALFSEARALIKDGRWDDACPKLEASHALDPALGTLLNLAECYAKVGKTASAWLRYREAAAKAVQLGQKEREAIARDRAKALEERLCKMTVSAPAIDGLAVRRDGAPSTANVALPVDPGKHEIVAEAPGHTSFTTQIDVAPPEAGKPCAETKVDVPAMLGGEVALASPASPLTPMPPLDPAPAPIEPHGWRAQHTLAVVLGGVGVAGIAFGSAFALDADATNTEGRSKCTPQCGDDARALIDDAGRSADIATVSFIAAGVFLAGAAVLWLTSPGLSK
jgi:hypothetical protein